jgi:DNA modification methylase
MERSPALRKEFPITVEWLPVAALKPDPRNARIHSKRQIRQIANSIREFGFTNPILIDEANRIIAGNARYGGGDWLGMAKVPVIRLPGLTEAQKRALALADNKLAENAGWDPEILAQELRYLSEIEVDFDVEITGFSAAEIDLLLERTDDAEETEDPVPTPPAPERTLSRPGDLWRLGHHRLLSGDARSAADVARLMDGARAQMVFLDPPYNVPIAENVCGLGSVKHPDFAMASGEMSPEAYIRFLSDAFSLLVRHSRNGSLHYVCSGWPHFYELLTAAREIYTEQKALCVWNKTNGGMGSLYRSKHELVAVFKNGNRPHVNNVELGRYGRNRSNVWDYAGVNTFREGRLDDLAAHPTVKPIALVADALLDASRRKGLVLDTFAGSGTTILAAKRTGRRAYALEIDPGYVDVALRRWTEFTGETPIHADSGATLEEIATDRGISLEQAWGPADVR